MEKFKAYTIGEVIITLAILLFLFGVATFEVWFSVINKAPECSVARDTISCVKLKQLGGMDAR